MKKIVVIDSGIGGLHVLSECVKQIPNYEFVYVADTYNSPYGNKSKKQLNLIAETLVSVLDEKYNPEIFVIACNTLTMNAIGYLRKNFPNKIFVGVEPPIKQAKLNGGNSILFATKSTLKRCGKLSNKIERNIKQNYHKQKLKYTNNDKIFKVEIDKFPQTIENNLSNLESLNAILKAHFDKPEFKSCKNFVIGCTHYVAVIPQIKKLFPEINICNNTNAVVQRVKSFCKIKSTKKENAQGRVRFLLTDGNEVLKQKFINYYNSLV